MFQRLSSSATSGLATVHRGTLFEERSMRILQDHLSMSLRRVGGRSDGGIDLMGWWWLPPSDLDAAPPGPHHSLPTRRRLRVLAQCKAEKKKPGPNYVRELEGVLHRYMSLASADADAAARDRARAPAPPLVALLVSESPFTKATLLRAQSSPVPFFLLHIPPLPDPDPDPEQQVDGIGTAVWNPALAGTRGLLGGKMEARWERSLSGAGRPGLWWGGQRLRSWTPDKDDEPLTMEYENHFFEAQGNET
ncbi:hypothetical protein GGX14DRAFT_529009 [Mycena pura]|uniref:Required for respiratory growth protein 7, mitochondrial n=1 Tax=Mycena pura TaxID=153505 RepID=A0AAD6UMS6_9AGAR|nr:hypothetical protein GGX14DRAFT_529009 [Mycena pura]